MAAKTSKQRQSPWTWIGNAIQATLRSQRKLQATIDRLNADNDSLREQNAQLDQKLTLKGDRVEFLEEQLAAYRDTLQAYQSFHQLHTALNKTDIERLKQ
jgi:chromosome segregation ATPase